jgi:hypothetical protein
LAAVTVSHGEWKQGAIPAPMEQVGPGEFTLEQDALLFPIAVTNGSTDLITHVRAGVRWKNGNEGRLGIRTPALGPGATAEGSAAEPMTPMEANDFEGWDFDQNWLNQLEFFVRFLDRFGLEWENTLRDGSEWRWESKRLKTPSRLRTWLAHQVRTKLVNRDADKNDQTD